MMAQLMVRSGEDLSPLVRRVSFWIAPVTASDVFDAATGMAMWDAAGYSRSGKEVYPPVVHLFFFS